MERASLFRRRGTSPVAAGLGLSSVLCTGMLAVRMALRQDNQHAGMAWNLALAWLPFMLALAAARASGGSWASRCGALVLGAVWLVFLPNAPYLVTDLVHWQQASGWLSWFDLIMWMLFAWTGCLLGLASLNLMHARVTGLFGVACGWIFVAVASALAGLGVYLGRIPRWNSWDLIVRPAGVFGDVIALALHPIHQRMPLAFAAAMGISFGLAYLTLIGFASLMGAPAEAPRR